MNREEYNSLDFYGKLKEIICFNEYLKRQLERIGSVDSAREYIDNLMDETLESFELFKQDDDFFTKEIFDDDLERLLSKIDDVLEIAPLIKEGKADYHYLIYMAATMISYLEKKLPRNVNLARFLNRLVEYKEDLSLEIGVGEEELEKVLGSMLEHVDEVDKIINSPKKVERVNRKK